MLLVTLIEIDTFHDQVFLSMEGLLILKETETWKHNIMCSK